MQVFPIAVDSSFGDAKVLIQSWNAETFPAVFNSLSPRKLPVSSFVVMSVQCAPGTRSFSLPLLGHHRHVKRHAESF